MRDDTGRIVLIDFGTGRAIDHEEGQGDRAGTPLYMAPEVLNAHPASRSSDVYSLGVLLYHLLTGEYPVEARTVEELRDAHAKRQHRWLSERRPDLPVKFMQVIERAIALDPEERYAHASELLTALTNLKLGARSRFRWLLQPALALAVVVGGMTVLGAMTSAMFNLVLQRSEFTPSLDLIGTVGDYLYWGRRTSFMPLMLLLVLLLAGTMLGVVRRLLLAVSANARRANSAVRRRLGDAAHRVRLDEVSVPASCALLLSTAAVTATWWSFTPLLLALVTNISTDPSKPLALLSPEFVDYQNRYRQVLIGVVTFSVAVWYPVARLIRKGQSPHWGFIAGGAIATCVALAFLHFPYRLLYANKFKAVTWADSRCYVTGERGSQLLLFCPLLESPRNRRVSANDSRLVDLGVSENIFTLYSAGAAVSGRTR